MTQSTANSAPKTATLGVKFAHPGSVIFATSVAVMAVVLVLSNIGATKGVVLGPIITDGGFFLFPAAYVVGDILSEVYGFRAARRAVITSFLLSIFTVVSFWIIIELPAAEWYDGQEALARTLGPVWLIVLASLLGFACGQTLNALVLVKMKERFGERGLVARLLSSSGVGEFVDTVIFCAIAAGVIGITTGRDFLVYLAVGIFYKLAVEAAVMPLTVWIIKRIKQAEPSYYQAGTTLP